jgi:hypothetical protein
VNGSPHDSLKLLSGGLTKMASARRRPQKSVLLRLRAGAGRIFPHAYSLAKMVRSFLKTKRCIGV